MVDTAVAGGLLYGLNVKATETGCGENGTKPCYWLDRTAIYGAITGGAAIATGISLLVKFDREQRLSLEVERKR